MANMGMELEQEIEDGDECSTRMSPVSSAQDGEVVAQIDISDDIPLEELNRHTAHAPSAIAGPSFTPHPNTSSFSSSTATCCQCKAYQEHAREAYQAMISLSRRLQRFRELELEKVQLERINAEQQTYLSNQAEKTRAYVARVEQREGRLRQLEEELQRMKEQYKMVLESSREFKRASEQWEHSYRTTHAHLLSTAKEITERRRKFGEAVRIAEAASEKFEAEERRSARLQTELDGLKARLEVGSMVECAFLREMDTQPRLDRAMTSPRKRRRESERTSGEIEPSLIDSRGPDDRLVDFERELAEERRQREEERLTHLAEKRQWDEEKGRLASIRDTCRSW